MKPQNPYKDCEQYSRMLGWDEGYEACANQPISEQEGWQTGEPSKDEGPFLLDLGDHEYELADSYIYATQNREAAFRSTTSFDFLYTFFKSVKRWKRI